MSGGTEVRPDPRRSVTVHEGPAMLSGVWDGPSLLAHRRRHGRPPHLDAETLVAVARDTDLRGRGGAGFPFARKLETAAATGGTPSVVVNVSEGEPASWKDAALACAAPHLVLDGALLAARALRTRRVHLVVPQDRPGVATALRTALAERGSREGVRWRVHVAAARFVAGQARAVVELVSGRENLPVTAWQPEAVSGVRGRPTLLSNAETFAALAVAAAGPPRTTRLLTLHGDTDRPQVREVAVGTPFAEVLGPDELARPVLLGGYHGTWAAPGRLRDLPVCPDALAAAGLGLGAGVVLPLAAGVCPLSRTAALTAYLAGQSARRCGPCLNGLPALAATLRELDLGRPSQARAAQLVELVTGRGACAHPDGTGRLVTSVLIVWPDEVAEHAAGRCSSRVPVAGAPVPHRGAVGR